MCLVFFFYGAFSKVTVGTAPLWMELLASFFTCCSWFYLQYMRGWVSSEVNTPTTHTPFWSRKTFQPRSLLLMTLRYHQPSVEATGSAELSNSPHNKKDAKFSCVARLAHPHMGILTRAQRSLRTWEDIQAQAGWLAALWWWQSHVEAILHGQERRRKKSNTCIYGNADSWVIIQG